MVRPNNHGARESAMNRRRILRGIFGSGITGIALSNRPQSLFADDKATRIAAKNEAASNSSVPRPGKPPELLPEPAESTGGKISGLQQARQLIAMANDRMSQVTDYSCTFIKQERIGRKLLPPQTIIMKGRTNPHSIYFSFQTVHKGREAIYYPAKFSNKLVAHEGGWAGYLAGTMHLDPTGRLAMSDNRHPVSEAGLNKLVTRVYESWHHHLQPEHDITIEHGLTLSNRSATLVQTKHDTRSPQFQYHMVQIFFDDELGLPVRFVGFDWPAAPNQPPQMLEDYQFVNLRVNTGLTNLDFDPANPAYAYKK
jgi:hypothetical protein